MTLLSTNNGQNILAPAEVMDLVVQPLIQSAISTQVSTVVQTSTNSVRFPIVVTDPATGWTAEGAEINVSDPVLDELEVVPKKLAGLTVVSSELFTDSDPAALDVVGDGLVRDLSVKLDAAYFGNQVANGPDGIESITFQSTTGVFDGSLDLLAEAISLAENAGVPAISPVDGLPNMAFVGHPNDVLALMQLHTADDSNAPLLGVDATAATARIALGVRVYSSPAVTEGALWLVPRNKSFVVMRTDPEVVADFSVFFTSHRVAIRAILRVGVGHPHEAAVVRVPLNAS
ncbi:phage major capsid protein [Mycolicibacterium elephantis]